MRLGVLEDLPKLLWLNLLMCSVVRFAHISKAFQECRDTLTCKSTGGKIDLFLGEEPMFLSSLLQVVGQSRKEEKGNDPNANGKNPFDKEEP